MAYNKKGYHQRARVIQSITDEHFEPESHAKSRKAVWRKHIYPAYGMCYRTYLSYLKVDSPPPPTCQLRLF